VKVTVITISDRAANGIYQDLSGQAIEDILRNYFIEIELVRKLVPDEKDKLLAVLQQSLAADFILTTGGTGISARDITPEVCAEFCDKELPGVAELLRAKSYEQTKNAILSRGYAGIKNKTIIVNFPGSVTAAKFCIELLLPVMEHALKMINNSEH
jgi:molybdopterin adenylyltransferase